MTVILLITTKATSAIRPRAMSSFQRQNATKSQLTRMVRQNKLRQNATSSNFFSPFMEQSFLDGLATGDTSGILRADQTVVIGLGEIGDALLVTVTIGFEAFGMLVGVVAVVHRDQRDDGVLFVVGRKGRSVGFCHRAFPFRN